MLTKLYWFKVGLSASMLLNVITGGEIGQTFSARQHAAKREKKFNLTKQIDFFCGEDHCSNCWSYWKVRRW